MRRCAAAPNAPIATSMARPISVPAALHLGRDIAHRLAAAAAPGIPPCIGAEHHEPDACRGLPGAIDELQRLGDGLPGDAARQIEREHDIGMARLGAGERPRECDYQRGEGQNAQDAGGDAPERARPARRSGQDDEQHRNRDEQRATRGGRTQALRAAPDPHAPLQRQQRERQHQQPGPERHERLRAVAPGLRFLASLARAPGGR